MPHLMFASGTPRRSPLPHTSSPPFSSPQQILLERLSTVGDVTVERGPAPSGFSIGFTWTITFETQIHDIESIVVDGNVTAVPIVGPNANLEVVEVRRGMAPSLDVPVTGLDPDEEYFTRVSAFNADGYGPTTLAMSGDGGARGGNIAGLGVSPLAVIAQSAPKAPVISHVSAVSASQLEVVLQDNIPSGVDPLGFKVRTETNYQRRTMTCIVNRMVDISSGIFGCAVALIRYFGRYLCTVEDSVKLVGTSITFACQFSTLTLQGSHTLQNLPTTVDHLLIDGLIDCRTIPYTRGIRTRPQDRRTQVKQNGNTR